MSCPSHNCWRWCYSVYSQESHVQEGFEKELANGINSGPSFAIFAVKVWENRLSSFSRCTHLGDRAPQILFLLTSASFPRIQPRFCVVSPSRSQRAIESIHQCGCSERCVRLAHTLRGILSDKCTCNLLIAACCSYHHSNEQENKVLQFDLRLIEIFPAAYNVS